MTKYFMSINTWSALLGLIRTVTIFFFGLPPAVNPKDECYLLLKKTDENEKNKGRFFKLLSYLGLIMI